MDSIPFRPSSGSTPAQATTGPKPLSHEDSGPIKHTIDDATSKDNHIPGVVICAVNKAGTPIFTHASGVLGVDNSTPMSLDTVFWIASCTKMIGGIAVMQLVEQGKIGLDDANAVEKICPELKEKKVLKSIGEDGKPVYEDQKHGITLRMLLTHTAGFGYSFFNHNLRKWGEPVGLDELSGIKSDVFKAPLVHQPGTAWEYGINVDWAGTVVERISGLKLNDYFTKHIFEPLGLKNISMFPTENMKKNLAYMHQKEPDGKIRGRDHLLRLPLVADENVTKHLYHSAGAGCFARPIEYCEILATLLNGGTAPSTGINILKPETVDEMFKNSIPQFPDFGRQYIPASRPDYTNPLPDLMPQGKEPQGWGLTAMHNVKPYHTGRSAESLNWAGLANLLWFADRKKGVAGMIATQILPYGNLEVVTLWDQVETAIYKAIG